MDFIYGAKTMAMPQRDDTIEAIKRAAFARALRRAKLFA